MSVWTDFDNQFTEFSNSINQCSPSEKLIKVNKWLVSQQENINIQENSTENVTAIVRQFPIVWNKKELFNHVKPTFEAQDYINYLKTLNKSFKNLPTPNLEVNNLQDQTNFNTNWMKITKLNVYQKLDTKNNNSSDFEGLKMKSLKNAIFYSTKFCDYIIENFNKIIEDDDELCQEWVSPNVNLRYKGGNPNEPKNFRPIIVFPLIVRLFDSIISFKLHNLVLEHNIIDTKVQKAVLKNLSGLWENSFEVNHEIAKNQNDILFFLDFKNAFGSVNYSILNTILKKYNFSPNLSRYVEKFYLFCMAKYKDSQMKWSNGLLQGSALSNILFLIYSDFCIKNIKKDMIGMKMDCPNFFKAFVDDLVISLKRENLEKNFKFINRLFSFYGFSLNCDKTYVYSNEEVKIGDMTFRQVNDEFNYLGTPLFINPEKFINDLKDKAIEKCILIDTFNVSKDIKTYIFYQNVFLRISRILEVYYLIHGKNESIDNLFEELMYFTYRWNVKDFETYAQKHLEYIFKKGENKLKKCINIEDFKIENVEDKYGINPEEDKTLDFKAIFNYDVPKTEDIQSALVSLKDSRKFKKEHFEKIGSNFYGNNFVENTH